MKIAPALLSVSTAALLALGCASGSSAVAPEGAGSPLNLEHGLALEGYDPTSYFDPGGEPLKGDPAITATVHGATWRFETEERRARFLADPERYEPAYGGWCAWAMVDGEKVDVDPRSFLIEDGRLLLFYDGFFGDTRARWLEQGGDALRTKADAAWERLGGASRQSAS